MTYIHIFLFISILLNGILIWMFKLSSDELEKYRNKYREKRCNDLERFFNDHFPGADINDFK